MNDASRRYWTWYANLLASWATQRSRRRQRRTVIVLGGPFVWLFLASLWLFAGMLYVVTLSNILAALTLVGLGVSAASGVSRAVNTTK